MGGRVGATIVRPSFAGDDAILQPLPGAEVVERVRRHPYVRLALNSSFSSLWASSCTGAAVGDADLGLGPRDVGAANRSARHLCRT